MVGVHPLGVRRFGQRGEHLDEDWHGTAWVAGERGARRQTTLRLMPCVVLHQPQQGVGQPGVIGAGFLSQLDREADSCCGLPAGRTFGRGKLQVVGELISKCGMAQVPAGELPSRASQFDLRRTFQQPAYREPTDLVGTHERAVHREALGIGAGQPVAARGVHGHQPGCCLPQRCWNSRRLSVWCADQEEILQLPLRDLSIGQVSGCEVGRYGGMAECHPVVIWRCEQGGCQAFFDHLGRNLERSSVGPLRSPASTSPCRS